MTALLGRPCFIGLPTVILIGRISLNLLAAALGHRPLDPPAFSWLEGAISLTSLYMVVLILGTQRREGQFAQQRELLGLELAILSEQKTAKVIQLVEEARRDSPHIHDLVDQEAEVMARPAHPQSVLDSIKETHTDAKRILGPGTMVQRNSRKLQAIMQDSERTGSRDMPRDMRGFAVKFWTRSHAKRSNISTSRRRKWSPDTGRRRTMLAEVPDVGAWRNAQMANSRVCWPSAIREILPAPFQSRPDETLLVMESLRF